MRWIVGVVAGSLVAGSASAAEPLQVWQPAGKWEVNFGTDQCVASRNFRLGDQEVVLGLTPTLSSKAMAITFRVPRTGKASFGWVKGNLEMDGRPQAGDLVQILQSAGKGQLLRTRLEEDATEQLFQAKQLGIRTERATVGVSLDGIGKVRPVLQRCHAQLLEKWGLSQADQQRLVTWPKPKNSVPLLFTADDYPDEAVRAGQQGVVGVLFRVEADGRVTNCRVRESSGHPILDRETCAVITSRARYEPGRASDGSPIAAFDAANITWAIPSRQ